MSSELSDRMREIALMLNIGQTNAGARGLLLTGDVTDVENMIAIATAPMCHSFRG